MHNHVEWCWGVPLCLRKNTNTNRLMGVITKSLFFSSLSSLLLRPIAGWRPPRLGNTISQLASLPATLADARSRCSHRPSLPDSSGIRARPAPADRSGCRSSRSAERAPILAIRQAAADGARPVRPGGVRGGGCQQAGHDGNGYTLHRSIPFRCAEGTWRCRAAARLHATGPDICPRNDGVGIRQMPYIGRVHAGMVTRE